MSTSVYQITNTVNGRMYFGKALDPAGHPGAGTKVRWCKHCWDAVHGKNFPLHRAIRKYGRDAFRVETLVTCATNKEASEREIALIAATAPAQRYNIAKGGDGGHTMTLAQLEGQYAIKTTDHPEFKRLFYAGASHTTIAAFFGASYSSVGRCAERLGLSFCEQREKVRAEKRNKQTAERARQKQVREEERKQWRATLRVLPREERERLKNERRRQQSRAYPSKATMTPEERSVFRAKLFTRSNKARGISEDLQREALRLYFAETRTAKEVAVLLGVSRGSVRATVNRAYATMPPDEHAKLKHKHGSAVRTGARNPNAAVNRPFL